MQRTFKWLVPVVVVALLLAGGTRLFVARKARQAEVAATVAAPKAEAAVELALTDIVTASRIELSEGLAISGTLKAVDSAWLKARVAGELRDLRLREGDTVKAGQVVARIDPGEYRLRQLQAQRLAAAASAQIDIAQRTYDNNRALVDKGFISRTALDASLATLNAAKANHEAAVAAADVASRSVADTAVRSPIDGRISQRLAQNGERVNVDARIAEVLDLSRMEFESSIPSADSIRVRIGQLASIRIEGSDTPIRAEVVRINPSASESSRSIPVYLRLESQDGLRQGLFAQGRVETARTTVLAVPLDAVRTDRPKPYVQALVDERIVHRQIELGVRGNVDGREMVGVKGVEEGARVLVGSVGAIREGTLARSTRATP